MGLTILRLGRMGYQQVDFIDSNYYLKCLNLAGAYSTTEASRKGQHSTITILESRNSQGEIWQRWCPSDGRARPCVYHWNAHKGIFFI